MKSIKTQLIIVTLLLVIIPFLISNGINYFFVSNELEAHIENQSVLTANSVSEYVTGFLVNSYSITDMLTNSRDIYNFAPEEQETLLVDTIKRYPFFELLFIQGTDGMQTARSSGDLGDRSNRWWFIRAMDEKQPFITKSYYSVAGNIAVTSVIMPIYDETNNLVGIMGSDIKLDAIQNLIDEKNEGTNQYTYVIDSDGVVIAHPDQTQVKNLYNYLELNSTILVEDSNGDVVTDAQGNQETEIEEIEVPAELRDMVERALAGESGVGEYIDNEGNPVISAYATISLPGDSGNWAVITTEHKTDAFLVVRDLQKRTLGIMLALILIVILASYFISNSLTNPLVKLNEAFFKAAKGDLTVRAEVKSNNEIGQASKNFNTMIENISELIKEVKNSSKIVFESSDSLTDITSQTNTATTEVATAIEEIAKSAGEQAKDAEMSAMKITELSNNIEMVIHSVEHINNISKETNNLSTKGLNIVNALITSAKDTSDSSKEINGAVLRVDESSGKIGVITETIGEIAEKTNLLALNAAIEAARAGEHGKGFAVVAEEVRKLAEQSATAVSEIKELIDNIQTQSKTAVEAMDKSKVIMKDQDDAVIGTENIFNEITSSIKVIMEKLSEIEKYNNDMDLKKDEFVDMIHAISSISQQTSAATQQVSASTEEQLAAIEEVANYSLNLNSLADNLKKAVEKFIV